MAEYIDAVGPQNVVQICTDNASAQLGACNLLEVQYPHVYTQGCAAHILDLLLEDWYKENWVKDLVNKAKQVSVYMRGHHVTMALF